MSGSMRVSMKGNEVREKLLSISQMVLGLQ